MKTSPPHSPTTTPVAPEMTTIQLTNQVLDRAAAVAIRKVDWKRKTVVAFAIKRLIQEAVAQDLLVHGEPISITIS